MITQQKLQTILEKHPIPPQTKLWIHTTVYSVIVLLATSLYLKFYFGDYTLKIANKAVGHTALLLIGCSLTLSSLCYFWNFADRYIMYRKHLGLVGFAYVIAHVFMSLVPLYGYFPFPSYFFNYINFWPFVFASIALVIYTIMAAVSNQYAIKEIGGKHWKMILRTGYIAYAFSILHFGMKTYGGWIRWLFQGKGFLPPLDLLVLLFGILILGLRLALWFSLSNKKDVSHP